MAEGETTIDRIYHLDRGYEKIDAKLSALGAMHSQGPVDCPHAMGTIPESPLGRPTRYPERYDAGLLYRGRTRAATARARPRPLHCRSPASIAGPRGS